MAPEFVPFLFILFIIAFALIQIYNRFIKYKNKIEESWSKIDVALKRRFNLIPNLVKTVAQYERHEAEVLGKIDEYRSGSIREFPQRAQEESTITQSLGGMLVIAEAYPDLKASANFMALQSALIEIETDIQKARDQYNNYISRFNTLVESFPSRYIASLFGFIRQEYFSLELATQRELPEVDFKS